MADPSPYRERSILPVTLSSLGTQGALYVLTAIVARAMSLVMVPVYTHRFGPSDYGVLELVDTLDLTVIAAFATPLTDPLVRHLHDADETQQKTILSTAILSLLIAGMAISAVGVAFSPSLAEVLLHNRGRQWMFAMTFLSVTAQAVVEVPFARLRSEQRVRSVAFWALCRVILGLVLNLVFVVRFNLGVGSLVLSTFIASTVCALAMVLPVLRETGLRLDRRVLKHMLGFGWPLIPGALAMIALGHARSYVINTWCTLAAVGIWSFGVRFGALITQSLGHPLRDVWNARVYALWDSSDGRGPAHFARAGTWSVGLYTWAAAGITVFARELVDVLAPPSFSDAVWVIPSAAAAYALREIALYFRSALLVGRRTSPLAYLEPALAIFDIVLSVVLVSRFGLHGAMAAFPLVFAVYLVVMHREAKRGLNVRFEYRAMVALSALALCVGAMGMSIHTSNPAASIAIKLLLIMAYTGVLARWIMRDSETLHALRRWKFW
jgi:O-antigen/teichoic acid export membrane protein